MTKASKTSHATTFHQQLVDYENRRHAARLAEIKKASSRLALFEPVAQALEAKGINLSLSWHLGGRSLRVTRGSSTMYDHGLYDALLELGFAEIERTGTRYQTVILNMGRLSLELSVEGGYGETTVSAEQSAPADEAVSQNQQPQAREWLDALPAWDGERRLLPESARADQPSVDAERGV